MPQEVAVDQSVVAGGDNIHDKTQRPTNQCVAGQQAHHGDGMDPYTHAATTRDLVCARMSNCDLVCAQPVTLSVLVCQTALFSH